MSDATLSRVRAREYPDPPQGIFLNAAIWGIIPKSAAEEAADLMLRRNRTHGFEEAELGAIQRRCRRGSRSAHRRRSERDRPRAQHIFRRQPRGRAPP